MNSVMAGGEAVNRGLRNGGTGNGGVGIDEWVEVVEGVSRGSVVHSEAGLRETRYATSFASASLRLNIRPLPPFFSSHSSPKTSASPSVVCVACRAISRSNTV